MAFRNPKWSIKKVITNFKPPHPDYSWHFACLTINTKLVCVQRLDFWCFRVEKWFGHCLPVLVIACRRENDGLHIWMRALSVLTTNVLNCCYKGVHAVINWSYSWNFILRNIAGAFSEMTPNFRPSNTLVDRKVLLELVLLVWAFGRATVYFNTLVIVHTPTRPQNWISSEKNSLCCEVSKGTSCGLSKLIAATWQVDILAWTPRNNPGKVSGHFSNIIEKGAEIWCFCVPSCLSRLCSLCYSVISKQSKQFHLCVEICWYCRLMNTGHAENSKNSYFSSVLYRRGFIWFAYLNHKRRLTCELTKFVYIQEAFCKIVSWPTRNLIPTKVC